MNMLIKLMLSFFVVSAFTLQAEESINQATEKQIESSSETAFINLKIGVELSALEKSAQQTADSISEMSETFKEMLANPEMNDEEQQQQIEATLQSLDNLALSFKNTIEQLPTTIEQTTPPIITAVESFFSEIKMTVIVVLVVFILILIIALIAVYFLVLAPAKQMLFVTTDKLNQMAIALQTTAQLVESSNKQHQEIIQSMQKMQDKNKTQ